MNTSHSTHVSHSGKLLRNGGFGIDREEVRPLIHHGLSMFIIRFISNDQMVVTQKVKLAYPLMMLWVVKCCLSA
jgi:hypothetical protein